MLLNSHINNKISILREEGPGATIVWLVVLSEQ